jgi:polyphosphate kinase
MEKSIKMRKKGNPVRVVYDQNMPKDLLESLSRCFKMDVNINAIPGGRYHNFKDFMKFPIFGHKEFLYESIQPQEHPVLKGQKSIIKQLLKQDVLLHFPYQKFDHVVDLIREAAIDPKVKSIKINIYRVAKESQVMNALINAMRNGKEVTVVLELQARFDEENNLYWAERLKEDGARVLYGFQELKIHSKLLQIRRISEKSEQFITYIGLLTANRSLSLEVNNVFHMMEQTLHRHTFRFLTVSPINARRKIVSCINNEMKAAKKGDTARIQIKINNLVDKHLIQKLYDASNAGVKIQLIIRGVCCLIPGIKGKSENIEIISIVDRFLEHTRMQIFHNNGDPLYFISSADWMERNMDQRIEVGTPIYDKSIQKELKSIFDIQWHDNVKARIIDKKQVNNYKKKGEKDEQKRSQYELMERYKN